MLISNLAALFPLRALVAFIILGFFGFIVLFNANVNYRIDLIYSRSRNPVLPWLFCLRPWVIGIFLLSCLLAFGGGYLSYIRVTSPAPEAWFSYLSSAEKQIALADIQKDPRHNITIQQFAHLGRDVKERRASDAARDRMARIAKALKQS
jgi:hypothetical protein